MSSYGPSGEPEYLSHGAPSQDVAPRSTSRKAVVLVASAATVVGVVGAGVWGFGVLSGGGGPQPDTAIPANALGYVALDLDPSTGQKLEALRALRRLPSVREELGDRDDIREKVLGDLLPDCEGVTYADDIEPWLGHRGALSAVESGDSIELFGVLQVTDRAKSEQGIAALADCVGERSLGTAYVGEYLVVADSQKAADQIAADAERAPLSADATYQGWMDRVGDPGIVTAYVGKDGPLIYSRMMFGFSGEFDHETEAVPAPSSPDLPPEMLRDLEKLSPQELKRTGFTRDENGEIVFAEPSVEHLRPQDDVVDGMVDTMEAFYADFEGFAGVVRFEGGGIEAQLTSKGLNAGSLFFVPAPTGLTHGTGTTIADLPADTGAAIGLAFEPGWLQSYIDDIDSMFGAPAEESIAKEMVRDLGVTVEELETLLGSAVTVAVDASVDPDAVNLDGPQLAGTPVAALLSGDPARLEPIIAKLRAKAGTDLAAVEVLSGDGEVAVGFDRAYTERLLEGGSLGESDRFRDAAPDAEDASSVIYADLNAGAIGHLIAEMLDVDPADMEPLSTFGMTDHTDDGGYVVSRVRLTFD